MQNMTNFGTFMITFDDFYDMIDSICDIKVQEEIKDFYGNIYDPSEYTLDDYAESVAIRVLQDLTSFLEENYVKSFEIVKDDGSIILYEPEERKEKILELFELVGEELFYKYAEEWFDEITLIYEKYIRGEELPYY